MLRIALASLRVRRLRSLLLAATVMLGVGILGGSIVYGDTAKAAFYDDLAQAASGVDVLARPWDDALATRVTDGGRDAVAAIPGVDHVDQRLAHRIGLLGRSGRLITNAGEVGLGLAAPSWPGFTPYRLVGREPRGPQEAAIDVPTATREAIRIGDQVSVVDANGRPHRKLVVGLADLGEYADTAVVILTHDELIALTGGGGAQIVINARAGTDIAALRQQVATTLGPDFEVITGDDYRDEIAANSAKYVSSFLDTLRVTAIVSLAVALLVVYNAYQVMVTQRAHDHALLRGLGASRTQIVGLVAIESLLVGGVAGMGSVALSLGTGSALLIGQQLFGGGIPEYSVVVSPLAVVVPFVTGILVSLVCAGLPAWTASRIPPMAALRAAADPAPTRPHGRGRPRVVVVAAIGVAASGWLILQSGRGQGFDGLPTMAIGGMLIFGALILLSPFVVTALSAPLRRLLGLALGATGRLAVANVRRHPVRFAATTAALTVGIAPMTAFAILITTARVQGDRELAENFPVDFVVSHAEGVGSTAFPAELVARLRADSAFQVVAVSRVAFATADGTCCLRLGTAEPGVLGAKLAVEVRDGHLGGLAAGTAAVSVDFATTHSIGPGDRLTLRTDRRSWTVAVVATYDRSPIDANLLINWSDFAEHGLQGDDSLLLRRADSTTAASARAELEGAVDGDPLAIVSSTAERRESLADSLGRRLIHFNVLLGLSMLIAILGIGNVLSLSALERSRESALLRALGLSQLQTYGMLLVEALLMALVGGALGVAFGLGFGWTLAHELLNTYGHGAPEIPGWTIAAYVGLGAAAGAIASILPARRSARVSITTTLESP